MIGLLSEHVQEYRYGVLCRVVTVLPLPDDVRFVVECVCHVGRYGDYRYLCIEIRFEPIEKSMSCIYRVPMRAFVELMSRGYAQLSHTTSISSTQVNLCTDTPSQDNPHNQNTLSRNT